MVGGGNTAVEEALYLTNHASRVTLIHRRDALRAEKILQARLFANPKIARDLGQRRRGDPGRRPRRAHVTGVRLKNVKTGAISELACDGVFVAIGHTPVTEMFRGQLALDADGYIVTTPGFDRDRRCPACSPPAMCATRSSARR